MRSEVQSCRIALAIFLKISLNPIGVWMSTNCSHLVSYFPSCLLIFAMNRTRGNEGKQFIVIELKMLQQNQILKFPLFWVLSLAASFNFNPIRNTSHLYEYGVNMPFSEVHGIPETTSNFAYSFCIGIMVQCLICHSHYGTEFNMSHTIAQWSIALLLGSQHHLNVPWMQLIFWTKRNTER